MANFALNIDFFSPKIYSRKQFLQFLSIQPVLVEFPVARYGLCYQFDPIYIFFQDLFSHFPPPAPPPYFLTPHSSSSTASSPLLLPRHPSLLSPVQLFIRGIASLSQFYQFVEKDKRAQGYCKKRSNYSKRNPRLAKLFHVILSL